MNRKVAAVLMFAVFIVAGCGAGAGGGVDRDVITEERIQASNANAVDQLIEWEEPRWLSNPSTRVYVDGDDWGSIRPPTERSPASEPGTRPGCSRSRGDNDPRVRSS